MFERCSGVIGNGSDFTGKTFAGGYTIGPAPTDSSYRTFYGCTLLTDYATLGPDWT